MRVRRKSDLPTSERHKLDEDDHPFMDDALDAYKKWLKKLPKEKIQKYIICYILMFFIPSILCT